MSFLDRIVRRRVDPTRDWPITNCATPDFDLSNMTFGPLRFGSNLQTAQYFGRPDLFTWKSSDYCQLVYAHGGFQLDFDAGCFGYLAFFIGQDEFLPVHPEMSFSQPRLKGGERLTQKTGVSDLRELFGPAESEDVDIEEETILFYTRDGITMEFELSNKGYLKKWNLFPKISSA